MSTAYEFYVAVKDNLVFKERAYMTQAKAPFEATNYMLYYFASNENNAEGKTCDYVMDRSKMWDCSAVSGCSGAYDFVGISGSSVLMRSLPCPCGSCCSERYDHCTNTAIVSRFEVKHIRQIVVECPDFLQLPLEGNRLYTNSLLKAFMRKYDMRVPGAADKRRLIQLVTEQLGAYLLPAVNVEPLP